MTSTTDQLIRHAQYAPADAPPVTAGLVAKVAAAEAAAQLAQDAVLANTKDMDLDAWIDSLPGRAERTVTLTLAPPAEVSEGVHRAQRRGDTFERQAELARSGSLEEGDAAAERADALVELAQKAYEEALAVIHAWYVEHPEKRPIAITLREVTISEAQSLSAAWYAAHPGTPAQDMMLVLVAEAAVDKRWTVDRLRRLRDRDAEGNAMFQLLEEAVNDLSIVKDLPDVKKIISKLKEPQLEWRSEG